MASTARIRPNTTSSAATDEILLAPNSSGNAYLTAILPSQAWELQQALSTTVVGASFTATLAATDITTSWLSQFINTYEFRLTGLVQADNLVLIQFLECNLVHPAPSLGSAIISLNFSTAKDVVHQQFGRWEGPQTGLEVFEHEAGLLLAVQNTGGNQPISFGSLLEFIGIHISVWARTLLNVIHLRLRIEEPTQPGDTATSPATTRYPPRNGLWVFAKERRTVLRLEFELDTGNLPKELVKFLPAHTLKNLSFTARKTAHFSLLSREPDLDGELFIASQILFQVDKDKIPSFPEVELDLYIFLSLNGISFKIHNECKVSFADMVLLLGEHLEEELKVVGVKAVFDELEKRLTTHMAHEDNKDFDYHWRELSMTFSGDALIGLSMVLEVDTPFGVDMGKHSAFLFTFQWSPKNNDIKVSGKFWPVPSVENRRKEKMPLTRLLNPADESHAIIQPLSPNAQSVVNLTKLYPGFSPGKLPHWIPDEITNLEVTLSTKEIDFQIYLRSQSAPDESPNLPFDEETIIQISFHYTVHEPESVQFSIEAGLTLNPPESLSYVDPCKLSVGAEYAKTMWTVSASAQNVRSANLYSLLPKSVRDDIIRMIPNVYVPGLFVDYTWGGTDPSELNVSGYLVVGGLLMTVYFQHSSDGEWGLVAKLNADSSKMAGEKTTIGNLIEDLMGDDAESLLPAYVNNVEIPLSELEDDGITLTVTKSDKGPVFGLFVRLGSLHFDFAQIPGGEDKNPKRLLRLSLHSFPEVPNIPLIGQVPQPFDQVGFVWSKYDFSWAEVEHLNATLFASSDALQVKASKDHGQNPIALKKGLHFMISMNQDGSPAVVIDYVFGQTSQKSPTLALTEKGETAEKKEPAQDETKISPATQGAATVSEVGPQSEMAPIKKSHNGLSITNVGVQMNGHVLTVHLNATVQLGPIEMTLTGFALHFDLTDAKLPHLDNLKPAFSLDGLAVSYDRNPIRVSGLFLHQKTTSATESVNTFAGGVVIGLSKYTFAAVGAYSEVSPLPPAKEYKSFFVFGALTGPLMHFEFGELRGISGGFGYNSFVNLPDVSAVSEFPFLGMMNSDNSDPLKTLEQFTSGNTIISQTDSLWFAAGLKLRVFEVIDVSAVVSLQLSQGDPVLAILADATAMVPQSSTVETAFALIDFGIIATLDLGNGTLMIQGQINPQSFVLSHACHPTGGFALCVWSAESGHGGDMVFSVGGFHPAFSRPSHYPNPPRVGISWIFDSHVSITGGAYYAITPSAIMAGGSLQVLFSMGHLSAHLDAHADFLVNFEPFHYQASIGVMAGVSYELKVWFVTKKLSINLGADLDLHGPPMAGIAHFSFWVMSFDVAFGSSKPTVTPLTLSQFWDMLSKGTPGDSNHVMAVEGGLLPPPTTRETKKNESNTKKESISLVRGGSLELGIYARVPINCATYLGTPALKNETPIYSRPMQLTNTAIQSSIAFDISPTPSNPFTLEPIQKDVPASIWGTYGVSDKALLAGNTPQTISHTMGVRLVAPKALRSNDNFPTLDSKFFGESTEIDSDVAFSEKPYVYTALKLPETAPVKPTSTPAAATATASTTDAFASVKNVWKDGKHEIDLAKALHMFAQGVADKSAFGAEQAPGMQPNSGWVDLEHFAKPPMQYVDHMEEYYLLPPQVLVATA